MRLLMIPSLAAALAFSGCLAPRQPSRADLGPVDRGPPPPSPLAIVDLQIRDDRGVPHPRDRVPRWPTLELRWNEAPFAGDDGLWVFAGPPEHEVRDDLAAAPLRQATLSAALDAAIERDGVTWRLRPLSRVAAGVPLVVGVASWVRHGVTGERLGAAWVESLRVASGPDAGAAAVASWPADGTVGVPPSLPRIAIRFDGAVRTVEEGVELFVEGERRAASASREDCPPLGWPAGECAVVEPLGPLPPDADVQVVVTERVRDATGAPVGPWAIGFRTASEPDEAPPEPLPLPCGLDEIAISGGCLLADDVSLSLRLRFAEPVRLAVAGAERSDVALAPRGEAELSLRDLQADRAYALRLTATDLAERIAVVDLDVRTTTPLATVSIVEVRADARGPEPRQEYVELLNYGTVDLDLAGFSITDRLDAVGDVLDAGLRLRAGQRALLVEDDFDPDDPDDPRVPPGVPLLRVAGSLATGGLSNAGEPLFLRDAEGRRVTAAPATEPPGPGHCLVRVSEEPRRGDASAFAPDPNGTCTPGREAAP